MKRFGFVVLIVVLSLFISSNLVALENTQRGKIVVITYDDFANKKSKIEYFLQLKDATLVPIPAERIGDFPPRSGQRAILSPNGKLHYSKNKAGIISNEVSGKINVLIALIQPSDEIVPWEAEKAEEYFQSTKDFIEDARQHSKVTLSVEATRWLKSTKPQKDFLDNDGEINYSFVVKEAISLTDKDTDFGKIDCLFVVVADSNEALPGALASLGDFSFNTNDGYFQFSYAIVGSKRFVNFPSTNSHEICHALFALPHEAGANTTQENGCAYQDGEAEEYHSPFSVMGSEYSFLSTWTQYDALGWLKKERVVTLSSSTSVKLELCPRELENTDGKQLVVIETGKKYISLEIFEKNLSLIFTKTGLQGRLHCL